MGNKLINWTAKYSVGNVTIDDQHQRLIELINTLYDAFGQGKAHDYLGHILDELVAYTIYHFSAEEDMFKDVDFPEKEAHHKEHTFFIEQIQSFKDDLKLGNETISYQLMHFLRDWLSTHILVADKKYGTLA